MKVKIICQQLGFAALISLASLGAAEPRLVGFSISSPLGNTDIRTLADPQIRKAQGPTLITTLKSLIKENPKTKPSYRGILYLLEDKETVSEVNAEAASSDPKKVADAEGVILEAQIIETSNNPEAQALLFQKVKNLVEKGGIISSIHALSSVVQYAASPEIKKDADRALKLLRLPRVMSVNGETTKYVKMENKPLTIKGRTLDGQILSTENWKGKVILVFFGLSDLEAQDGSLSKIKEIYNKYHANGLEILGVSSGRDEEAVRKFTQTNGIVWPQLFEKNQMGMHPLNQEYGIFGVPHMFLIDQNGVLVSATANYSYEEAIPILLDLQ